MRRLSTWLDVPFDDKDISMAELIAFTTDHLQRMIANNQNGELDARIAATTSALALVQQYATDDNTKLGLREARKLVKNALRKAMPAKIAKIAAAVGAQFTPNGPEMLECFPQGRSLFSNCPDDQVGNHLGTLIAALGNYQPALATPLADATALKTQWDAVWLASESSTGAKTATEQQKKFARDNLQLMLFLNLLKLAEMFPRQPEQLDLYMQQSLLEDHPQEEEPETPTPPPGPQ